MGACVGPKVGDWVGTRVGACVGARVGVWVGERVGDNENGTAGGVTVENSVGV